jgi:hypothetical protein
MWPGSGKAPGSSCQGLSGKIIQFWLQKAYLLADFQPEKAYIGQGFCGAEMPI